MFIGGTIFQATVFTGMGAALIGVPTAGHGGQAGAASPTNKPEEIVVTARRRDEPLGRAGVPVSALSGAELIKASVRQVDQLNERFPALTVQPTATGNLIFVRGVGNFTLLPNSDPAVGFAYDGVFIGRPMGTKGQFFDLERVELLKGPQGVLYGRNASAGSINIEPRHPVIGERSVDMHLSVATHSHEYGEAAVNVPLSGQTALRISAAIEDQDHLLSGYDRGLRQRSVRAQIKTLLDDKVTIRLAGDYNQVGGVGIGTSYVGNYLYVPQEARYRFFHSGLPLSDGIYSPRSQSYRQTIAAGASGRSLDAISSRPRQDHRFYGTHARIDADLNFAAMTLIPAWRRASIDAVVSGSPFGYRQLEEDEQTSVEARLTGKTGLLEWLVGGFVFDESIDADTATNLSSSLVLSQQNYETRSRALFGNGTLHVLNSLRLSGGLRWTRDDKNFSSNSETLSIICQRVIQSRLSCPTAPLFQLVGNFADVSFPVPNQPGARPILVGGVPTGAIVVRSARKDEDKLIDRAATWRVGAEADIGRQTLVYATVETGNRPGGFNSALGFETFGPERITAYTLGLRHRGLADRLQLDLEGFWWNYRDQQVSSLRPDLSVPARNANITDNIGNSRIRGIEADVRLAPWRGGHLRAITQFLDADYRSFEYVQTNTGVRPLTGCQAALNSATNLYTIDCSAKQPYNSPRWSISLLGRQRFRIGRSIITVAADTHFRAARNIGFAFLDEQRIGASRSSNAQIMVRPEGTKLELAGFVRNIEGRRIPQFMIYHPVSNLLVAGTSAPRQWGFRASLPLQWP